MRVWVLDEDHLREMLERASKGESVELILLEEYANADGDGEIKGKDVGDG